MNKNYWLNKWKIPKDFDTIFYQNPKFFRNNSFKKESVSDELDEFLIKHGKVKIYLITGLANNHHKHSGKRYKVCLVREFI